MKWGVPVRSAVCLLLIPSWVPLIPFSPVLSYFLPAMDSHGVVVESLHSGSVLEKAGLRTGDIVHSWWSNASSAKPGMPIQGEIRSPYDWFWLEAERTPREPLQLQIVRQGVSQTIPVAPGPWLSAVRPRLSNKNEEILSQARTAFEQRHFEQAATLLHQLLNEVHDEIHTSTWVRVMEAQAWAKAGNARKSEGILRAALSKAEEAGTIGAGIQTQMDMAQFHRSNGDIDAAFKAYSAAAVLVNRLGNEGRLTYAWIELKMADLSWRKRDLQNANELSRSTIDIYSQLAPKTWQFARALNTAGNVQDELGFQSEAETLYRRALEVSVNIGDDDTKLACLNNLGAIAYGQGDYIKASHYFEEASTVLAGHAGREASLAQLFSNMGSLSHAQGRLDEAEHHFQKALKFLKHQPDIILESTVYLNLGRTAISRKNVGEAENLCKASLQRRESTKQPDMLLRSPLECLSIVAGMKGDLETARSFAERALRISEDNAPQSIGTADSLARLAEIHIERKAFETAEKQIRRALLLYEKLSPSSQFHARSLHNLALIYSYTGRRVEAGELFERAVSVLEHQLEIGHEAEVDRAAQRARESSIYTNYIEHLIQEEKLKDAFHLSERWRAGSFLALMTERDLIFSEIPGHLDQQRRQLSQEHDRIMNGLTDTHSSTEIETLQAQLLSWRARHQELLRNIRRAHPKFATLRYPKPLGFKAAQESLEPGTVMLSFIVYPKHLQVFAIPFQGQLQAMRIDLQEEEIHHGVKLLRNILSEPQLGQMAWRSRAMEEITSRLYSQLVHPLANVLDGASQVVIIPDGPLHIIPWGALTRRFAEPNQSNNYFAEWKPFHIALSATAYAEVRENRNLQRALGTKTLAAFGDPKYSLHEPSTVSMSSGDVRFREMVRRGLHLDPLPGSRREIQGISTIFPGTTKIYLGSEATEERVKGLPRGTNLVHFAVHTRVDEDSPLESAVALSIPEKFVDGQENGLLQAWEIFERVRLDSDLVVLSACESGLGKEMGGEGLIGLTRAFQYAGARSIMASLWKISDSVTAEFMVRFYRHLREGFSKVEALQATQIEFIRGPIQVTNEKGERVDFDASAPYYWAAFQIYGDWQ